MDAFIGQILCCCLTAKDNEQQEDKKEPKGSQNTDTQCATFFPGNQFASERKIKRQTQLTISWLKSTSRALGKSYIDNVIQFHRLEWTTGQQSGIYPMGSTVLVSNHRVNDTPRLTSTRQCFHYTAGKSPSR